MNFLNKVSSIGNSINPFVFPPASPTGSDGVHSYQKGPSIFSNPILQHSLAGAGIVAATLLGGGFVGLAGFAAYGAQVAWTAWRRPAPSANAPGSPRTASPRARGNSSSLPEVHEDDQRAPGIAPVVQIEEMLADRQERPSVEQVLERRLSAEAAPARRISVEVPPAKPEKMNPYKSIRETFFGAMQKNWHNHEISLVTKIYKNYCLALIYASLRTHPVSTATANTFEFLKNTTPFYGKLHKWTLGLASFVIFPVNILLEGLRKSAKFFWRRLKKSS